MSQIPTLVAPFPHPSLVSDRAIDAARPLKVIYIGAGISGIVAAIKFLNAVPNLDLVIYEKNPELGGTWYPGCACDIPSHSYQLSFESWTDWSSFYAEAPEILEYWKRVAAKYDVRPYIRFSHKCLEASWDETRSKWRVKLEKLDQDSTKSVFYDESDVLMTGTGLLNEWKWPSIPGLKDFTGDLLHTANWNTQFDATDKKVAVVGGGSSGIQVVPAILPRVKAMDHYIRGRTWISTQLSEDVVQERTKNCGSANFEYTTEEKKFWKVNPQAYIQYRKELEHRLQGNYAVSRRDDPRHSSARAHFAENMRSRLASKPELADILIPSYPPLCKRLTPGPGYLEALTARNVDVVTQPISHIDAEGIVTTDGVRRPVDAIICATGFETAPEAGFSIYGQDGLNLRQKYAVRPKSYLGLCTDGFPNFFQSLGPNSFQGAGSLLVMIEQIHLYVGQILRRMSTGNIKTIEPKRKQVENFTNYCDEYFQKTVYTTHCISWYKQAAPGSSLEEQINTRITALWPGSSVHALKALETVRWEDFKFDTIDNNEFGWFGNGWSLGDKAAGSKNVDDLAWYINSTKFLHRPLNDPMKPESSDSDELLTCDSKANNGRQPLGVGWQAAQQGASH
ncbi:hypothetical protein QQS21_009539 [Conoideocrella luteorostrata]|uniref:Flavin-binding monooxygenase n=1 Tax=Conoideocrella luteorostrata TaxID=1105319 RepID=A0AAJ0FQA7_9HYPO|nr:hypothetical protein QQS21_009539 [Conoideocrella luteorostrata]